MIGRYLTVAAVLTAGLFTATSAKAQTIRVQIVETGSSTGIAQVNVEALSGDEVVAAGATNASGVLVLYLRSAGVYRLQARRLGYAPVASDGIEVGVRELVEVSIPMSSTPIELAGIRVEARRVDPRVEPTYEGLYARRQSMSGLGSERVLVRTDPQMRNVGKVSDVLRWLPQLRGCVFMYVDGRAVDPKYWSADDFFMTYPVKHLEGIEFYRDDFMMPVGFEPPRREFLDGRTCSAVVIWTRRPGT